MYNVFYLYALSKVQQAWEDARNAQTRGDLAKKNCQSCGSSQNVEAHHPNYSKGTQVRWLCKSCHKNLELRKDHTMIIPEQVEVKEYGKRWNKVTDWMASPAGTVGLGLTAVGLGLGHRYFGKPLSLATDPKWVKVLDKVAFRVVPKVNMISGGILAGRGIERLHRKKQGLSYSQDQVEVKEYGFLSQAGKAFKLGWKNPTSNFGVGNFRTGNFNTGSFGPAKGMADVIPKAGGGIFRRGLAAVGRHPFLSGVGAVAGLGGYLATRKKKAVQAAYTERFEVKDYGKKPFLKEGATWKQVAATSGGGLAGAAGTALISDWNLMRKMKSGKKFSIPGRGFGPAIAGSLVGATLGYLATRKKRGGSATGITVPSQARTPGQALKEMGYGPGEYIQAQPVFVYSSPAYRSKVHKVLGEYKAGTLKSSNGQPVKDRKQAIAIALSEARSAQ